VGVVLVTVLILGVALVYIDLLGFLSFNLLGRKASLGPDWTCTYPGKGDPVCLKKQPPN
jgi:hypothetical protein